MPAKHWVLSGQRVYQYLSSEPNLQQFLPRALAGLQYNNRVDPLPRTLARQLYGTPVRT
ncbi:MAG: hypothetical protein ACOX2S_07930 [bacterium]